jgi:hypothetical protein
MAAFNLSASQSFPDGTTVNVFPRSAKNPGGAPVGSSVTSAVVAAGVAAFTGLTLGTPYTAYALVSSQHRYMDFAPAVSDASVKRQVLAGITLVEVTVDLPSMLTLTANDVNVAVPAGTCKAGDLVLLPFLPSLNAGIVVQGAGCVATDSIRLRVLNTTAGTVDPAAVSVTFAIIKV